MGSLSAFEEPQKHIDWGKKASAEAQAIWKTMTVKEFFAVRKERDAQTGEELTKVVQVGQIPSEFERKCTEALNNFRNSFDQAVFAVCKAINKPLVDTHYPWADNPDPSLRRRLEGSGKAGKTIPVELWDTIRAQEPYPTSPSYSGGDDVIRQLAKIANSKHTIGFKVSVTVDLALGPIHIERVEPGQRFAVPPLVWDPVKKEVVVRRTRGNPVHREQEAQIAFYVAFDAPSPLGEMPAHTALERFATKAQEVVDTFTRRAVELGAS